MARQQIISIPELIGSIAEHLEPHELCCLRTVSSTMELNTRSIFAKKCFSKKCVTYTERGLRRLLAIARSERLSGALKTMEFFHVSPGFGYSTSTLQTLAHEVLFHQTMCDNKPSCRAVSTLACARVTSATDETCLNEVSKFCLYVGFLREQQLWWDRGRGLHLLTSIFWELRRREKRYRISIIGDDFQSDYPKMHHKMPKASVHGTTVSCFDVNRVYAQLQYVGPYTMMEHTQGYASFNRVLSTILKAVSMSEIKMEALAAPSCSLNGDFDSSLRDAASRLPQSLRFLTDLEIGLTTCRSITDVPDADVDHSSFLSASSLSRLTIYNSPGDGCLSFGWVPYMVSATLRLLPPGLRDLQLWRVGIDSRNDLPQFILNHAATLEAVTLSQVNVPTHHGQVFESLKRCPKLATLRISEHSPSRSFVHGRHAIDSFQDHPDAPDCLSLEPYHDDTVCVVRRPLLLPFLEVLKYAPE